MYQNLIKDLSKNVRKITYYVSILICGGSLSVRGIYVMARGSLDILTVVATSLGFLLIFYILYEFFYTNDFEQSEPSDRTIVVVALLSLLVITTLAIEII